MFCILLLFNILIDVSFTKDSYLIYSMDRHTSAHNYNGCRLYVTQSQEKMIPYYGQPPKTHSLSRRKKFLSWKFERSRSAMKDSLMNELRPREVLVTGTIHNTWIMQDKTSWPFFPTGQANILVNCHTIFNTTQPWVLGFFLFTI